MTVVFTGGDFFKFLQNCKYKFLAGNILVTKSSLFFWGGEGEQGGGRGEKRERTDCCAPAVHQITFTASRLCWLIRVLYSACWREGKRKEERRVSREKRKRKGGGGRERSKERSKDRKEERERESPLLSPSVLMSSTPPWKRLRVQRQDARMLNTCVRLAAAHGGVLNQHTEACWTWARGVFPRTKPCHTPHIHTTTRTLHQTHTTPNTKHNLTHTTPHPTDTHTRNTTTCSRQHDTTPHNCTYTHITQHHTTHQTPFHASVIFHLKLQRLDNGRSNLKQALSTLRQLKDRRFSVTQSKMDAKLFFV